MKRIVFLNFIIIGLLISFPVFAETESLSEGEVLDFNIEAIEHKGQLNKDVGYFHVSTKEDLQNNPLVIKINNNSDRDEEFQIEFHTARTNKNGLIVYDVDSFGPNEGIKHNLEKYIDLSTEKIVVPKHSSKNLEIKIDTSKFDNVNGILVGALKLYKTREFQQDVGIGNRFAYQLGVVLNSNVNGTLPNSEFLEFDKESVNLILNDNKKVIEYKINNLEEQIARNLTINSKLVNSKNERVILKSSLKSASIAPNGIFPGELDWERYDVEPGDYKLVIDATDGNKEWSWEHQITITKADAKEINELSTYKVMLPRHSFWMLPLMVLASGLNHYKLLKKKGRLENYEK